MAYESEMELELEGEMGGLGELESPESERARSLKAISSSGGLPADAQDPRRAEAHRRRHVQTQDRRQPRSERDGRRGVAGQELHDRPRKTRSRLGRDDQVRFASGAGGDPAGKGLSA